MSTYGSAFVSATHNQSLALQTQNPAQILQLRLRKSAYSRQGGTNFATPENDFFYTKSPYFPLSPERQEMRLLRVYPRKPYVEHIADKPEWRLEDHNSRPFSKKQLREWLSSNKQFNISDPDKPLLACEIVDTALSRVSGAYCTVSYCAGDRMDTSVMLVDGLPFNAFSNLEHAIGCAVDDWIQQHPGREMLLWADQICIDQRNVQEKSHQVRMMDEIYKQCNTTFVCLDTPGSEDTLRWIRDGCKLVDITRLRAKILEELLPSSWPPKRHHRSPNTGHDSDDEGIGSKAAINQSRPLLPSLHACFTSPWWRRAWVFQELILSKNPMLTSSSTSIPWSALLPLLQWACQDLGQLLHSSLGLRASRATDWTAIEHQVVDEWLQQDNVAMERQQKLYEERRRRIMSGEERLKGSEDDDDPRLFYLVSPLQRRRIRKNPLRIIDHRYWSGRLNLRHTTDEQRSEYLRQMQSNICKLEANIRFHRASPATDHKLKQYQQEQAALGDLLIQSLRIFPPQSEVLEQVRDAEKFWRSERRRLENWYEKLYHIDLTAVRSMIQGKERVSRNWDLMSLLQHSRNCDATDERDRIYAFMGLTKDNYGITASYSSENTIVHVLIKTALQLIHHSKSLDILHHVHQGRDRRGPFIPTWVPDWTSRPQAQALDLFVARCAVMMDRRPFNACNGYKADVSCREDANNPQHTDLKVRGIRVGVLYRCDGKVEGFPALWFWATKEEPGVSPAMMVVTPQSVEAGDEVWVLHGAKRPVLLRQQGVDTRSFLSESVVFDGDVYADVMYGASLQRPQEAYDVFIM